MKNRIGDGALNFCLIIGAHGAPYGLNDLPSSILAYFKLLEADYTSAIKQLGKLQKTSFVDKRLWTLGRAGKNLTFLDLQ